MLVVVSHRPADVRPELQEEIAAGKVKAAAQPRVEIVDEVILDPDPDEDRDR